MEKWVKIWTGIPQKRKLGPIKYKTMPALTNIYESSNKDHSERTFPTILVNRF